MGLKTVTRRGFVAGATAIAAGGTLAAPSVVRAAAKKPNILFIAVDDLNDWIEPLGGYPGVKTPNLKRLAAKTRSFKRAYTPAPACSPARSSLLFGVQPFHSGVYTNYEQWQLGSRLVGQTSLPRFLKDQGYLTVGAGKIFHDGWRSPTSRPRANDPKAWSDYDFCIKDDQVCEISGEDLEDAVQFTEELTFGETDLKGSEMPDIASLKWFNKRVLQTKHDKPFFGAIGLRKPHGPFVVPRKYFNLYPEESLRYPPGVLDPTHNLLSSNKDVKDLPPAAIAMLKQFGEKDHKRIIGGGYWKDIVRAYLATISFSDYCLGLILNAWLDGPNASNTIVVLWSDHGWQLGEKLGWRKFTLWERATRVPYMIGGTFGGREIRAGVESAPVSTLSFFPTIAELALGSVPSASDLGGLKLDGISQRRRLLDQSSESPPAVSTWLLKTDDQAGEARQRHFSVRSARYRLISYGNGDRELYDHNDDPYEFNNLLFKPTSAALAAADSLAKYLPKPSECVARAKADSA
ncbi:sulfatase [Methylopila sp. M107]|uniref:sulfatase n=1 Tax=Methylopila sp. M107 TaxID=1101190 RepID=UPI00035D281F|nr:sulfatase [Methylopila sp. M107]